MPLYTYCCPNCFLSFERRASVEHRDLPQVCQQCGNGAFRYFVPGDVQIQVSWAFNACMISDVEPTYAQQKAQDEKNERYLATKPKEKPSFEDCVKQEFDKRGIRHPDRLIDPKAHFYQDA